jgi:hypothetical protein
MVRSLHELYACPISLACELLELPRSSYYYRSRTKDESRLLKDLNEVAGQHVTYGTRRVAANCAGSRTTTASIANRCSG